MAFEVAPTDRSTAAGLRRIATEELDIALSTLARPDAAAPARVHGLRKGIKKLRGLLRLVQPRFDGFAAENAALAEAGRLIGGLRDAEVRVATFARLAPAAALPDPAAAAFAAALEADRRAAALAEGEAAIAALQAALAAIRARVPGWRFDGHGFELLADGLARTWDRAERARHAAAAARAGTFAAEPFHDWRKRVKAHWYQARLLAPIWPAMLEPHIGAADALGEALGEHNDIAVLIDHLAASPAAIDQPAAMAALAAAARSARAAIADAALPEGRRLFAGSSRALVRRWGVWWSVWRDAAGQAARSPDSARSISATVSATP